MVFRWVHRYIHKSWDQIFSADGIYSSDCPICRWTEATRVQSTDRRFSYRRPFQRDAMWATPYRSRSHRTAGRRAQNDVCRAPSTGRANPAPKTAPDDFWTWWPFGGNSDAVGCPCASLDAENQMCRSVVRTDNRRQRHGPTRTFDRAPCDRWSITSCAPSRQRGCRSPFSCPGKRRTVAVSVDSRTGPSLAYKWIFPAVDWSIKNWDTFEFSFFKAQKVRLHGNFALTHLTVWIEHPIGYMEIWIGIIIDRCIINGGKLWFRHRFAWLERCLGCVCMLHFGRIVGSLLIEWHRFRSVE